MGLEELYRTGHSAVSLRVQPHSLRAAQREISAGSAWLHGCFCSPSLCKLNGDRNLPQKNPTVLQRQRGRGVGMAQG